MEVVRLGFTGKSMDELERYLELAYYDLFNWLGAQRVAGHFIYDEFECVKSYLTYACVTHGVKVVDMRGQTPRVSLCWTRMQVRG